MSESDQETPVVPISDYEYDLPSELIAQHPLENRSESRLLVLERASGKITHATFQDIGNWLKPGDLLVLNNTRVFPARLLAQRSSGGRVEFLLLEPLADGEWRAMARPARRLKPGETLSLLAPDDSISEFRIGLTGRDPDGTVRMRLPDADAVLEAVGRVPLPSYIHETLDDPGRYQTIYAQHSGSVAAPTAGLHFTHELLTTLLTRGIEIAHVTLHVGPGTFQPVKLDDAALHTMHAERYSVPAETCVSVNRALNEGRRVIAVGTTSCRTLEAVAPKLSDGGDLTGTTDLYIMPGFEFQVVGGLLTNFHLPRSTLLLLVSAFAGRELVLRAYRAAIAERYRFFSFGDAMLIV